MSAARALAAARPVASEEDVEALRCRLVRTLPDLTTSAGPPLTLDPPLTAAECKYLLGEATRTENREAHGQFSRRAAASPDREFWTGFDDDDDP